MSELERILDGAISLQRASAEFTGVSMREDTDFDIDAVHLRDIYLKKLPGCTEEDATTRAVIQVLVSKWRWYKTVYHFAPEFMDVLMGSEPPQVHLELLRRLPVPNFFVYSPREDGLGFFVDFEFYQDGLLRCSVYHITDYRTDKDGTSLCGSHLAAVLHDGESLETIVTREAKSALWTDGQSESASAILRDNLRRALMSAYYLAAKNADLKPVKTKKENRTRLSSGVRLNAKKWEVGFRVARQFEKMYRNTEETAEKEPSPGTKSPPKPHIRRAHWHHYWTGPGRTILEVKWLEPILVMGAADDMPAVSRTVSGNQ